MVVLQEDFDEVDLSDTNPEFLSNQRIAPCTSYVMRGTGLGIVLAVGPEASTHGINYTRKVP